MQKIGMFVLLCLITTVGWAQKVTVKGTVTDANDGTTLPGVSILVKGTSQGSITDFDGKYTIQVEKGQTIVFRFVGYKIQEVKVSQATHNVVLALDTKVIDEVVVVGYGQQNKKSVIASISQTKGEELMRQGSVTSVSEAVQGLMPGVTAISTSGKPGADAAEIFIRGKATWVSGGTDPLVLVDGVERDMNDVDPNEIETFSVLKDASATAVYGVKGGNGVILITTKRGKKGKPKVNFSANFGFKVPTTSPDYADYITSMEMRNEALANDQMWESITPESTIEAWRNAYATGQVGPYSDYFPEVNWWDEMVKEVGYQQQYNVNVRGGTEKVRYFASVGYLNDDDIYNSEANDLFDPSFNYKRFNWRTNFDFQLTKTTDLAVNIAGKLGYRNQAGYRIDGNSEDGWGQANFFNALYTAPSNLFPIEWSNGTPGTSSDGSGNLYLAYDYGQRIYKYFQGFYDFKLNQKLDFITSGLSAKLSVSFTNSSNSVSNIQRFQGGNFGENNYLRYSRVYDYTSPNGDGTYPLVSETRWPGVNYQTVPSTASYDNTLNGGFSRRLYYEAALNYKRSFGDHNVSALALFSRRENIKLGGSSASSIDLPYRQEDWAGRLTYNYKETYLLELNGSYNGSENFAPGMRFGFFPSVSVGYRLSEEPFVKERLGDYVSNLKLRYSYGTSGQDNTSPRFAYQQAYGSSGNAWFGTTTSTAYGPLFTEQNPANVNATWETSTKKNFAIEFGFLNKLTGTVDIFDESRTGILMAPFAPLWYSVYNSSANIGETKNRGMELELGWNEKIGALRYWAKLTYSFSENRIVARGDGVYTDDHLKQAGKSIGWQSRYLETGYYQSLDDIYNHATPNTTGLQGQLLPGDFIFVDYDANGEVTIDDKVVVENLQYPLTTYGLNLGAEYKGISVSVRFYAVSDLSKEVPAQILWDVVGASAEGYRASPTVENRWTPETAETATKPVLHGGSAATYSKNNSTYTYQDASYIRLKNAEIAYRFNKRTLRKIGLGNLQVYCNGNNLLTWTKLDKRLDPEAQTTGVYPMIRRFNIGLRAGF